jgi:aspartyl/asparaginyl beta-hydroxylase (cupin superfamily)
MQTLDAMDSKKRAFPELLQKHFGLITPTCKEIGISRQTYYNWREADPVFAKECDECVETTCDFVENRLMDCIAS